MNRARTIGSLCWCVMLVAPLGSWRAAVEGAEGRKPNVLLICVDDLKPLLSCYGDKLVKSPAIDRLAARGIVFERAYCNQAVCSPSRNALMTGLRPDTLGIYDLGTNFRKSVPDAVTLAQHFKNSGYRTEAMGKIFHVGHGNTEDPASWSVPHWRPGGGMYVLKGNVEAMRKARAEGLAAGKTPAQIANSAKGAPSECADVPDTHYADGMIADEAVRRIEAAKSRTGEPFFIAVGFLKPHLPFCAPRKYWDLYKRDSFVVPALRTPPQGAPAFAKTTWGELRAYTDIPDVGPLSDDKARELIHGYHAAVSYMDAQLGRVLDALDQSGLAKDTLIVMWGDHGWHLGDHGFWCKHTNYEQAARLPLLVSVPGARAGVKTGALVENVDVYPTLCELAGLPIPKGLDGSSFASVLKDPAAATKDHILHVFPRGGGLLGRAVRTARYRMVEWKKPGADASTAVYELYDYDADPAETKNLADDKPEVIQQLKALLARHPEAKPQIKAQKAPGPAPGPGARRRGNQP